MDIVFALESAQLFDKDGVGHQVIRNQPWDAEDPLVKLHPGHFAKEPRELGRTTRERRVEAATAAPGEKRNR